ncbi:hypothetical protein D4R20_02255 [bacterium]|nr:MAG: hypothetical protein D4R20_02255 [bacterium]
MKETFPKKIDPEKAKKKYIELYIGSPDFNLEEFEFHQGRFEAKAEKHAKRGFLKRVFDRGVEKDYISFAFEEALRENAEWNKMYHMELQGNGELKKEMNAEFKEWHKMLEVVLENLKKKRDDPNGEGKEVRPLLLVLGGGMAGSYGAGQVSSLVHSGYMKTFNQAVGISAGACDIAYALAGKEQVLLGSSIYYEDCTKDEFLVNPITDTMKLVKNPGRLKQIMNVGYLSDVVFDHGPKKLDIDAIQQSSTEFYVQATDITNPKEQKSELINAKEKGIIKSIHASMALPWVYRKSVEIDGKQYQDGALLESFPLEEVIKKFKPTDVLVLPQVPFENIVGVEEEAKKLSSIAKYIPNMASLNIGSATLLKKFIQSRGNQREALEYIQEQTGVNVGIMYPPNCGMMPITNDPETVKASVLAAAKRTCEDLGEEMNFKLK